MALAAVTVFGVGLGGCGLVSGPQPVETQSAETAVGAMSVADSQRAWSELELRLLAAQTAAGSAGFKTTYTGSATDDLGVQGLVVTGAVDVTDGQRVRLQSVTPEAISEGTYAEMLWSRGTSYLRVGPLVDLGLYVVQPVDIPDGAPLGSLYGSVRMADPAAQLHGMADAVTSFEALGHAEARGVSVDQYRVALDGTLLEGPVVDGLSDGTLDDGAVEALIVVGDGDLIHKMELTLQVNDGEGLTVTSEYFKWGYSIDSAVNPPHDDFLLTPEESAEVLGWSP